VELDEGVPFVFQKNGVNRGLFIRKYWDFIPSIVRPYFVKKVCFYGPESTGKTTLAMHLAEVYQTEFVPEVSREMITSNDFTEEDIIRIGYAQTQRVLEKVKKANRILFCDTDLITTQIYSQQYLRKVPGILYELERQIKYDLYFLFDIDLPWVDDGLRNLGNQRKEMYDVFKDELVKRKIPFINVQGNQEEREQIIKRELNRYFHLTPTLS
jgi:HTH-type transcriptional repressor of NAD biosynthesis genes